MFEMIGTVFNNMFSSPAARKRQKSRRAPFERTRGKAGLIPEGCSFCGKCSKICSSKAIEVTRK